MPTPPPWCTDTHVAPAAVLSSAFRIGQSAIASEPSRIASVSRYGEATEPASRWSRPITTGALTRPLRDELVDREPGPRAVAVAEPADPRGQALEGDPPGSQLEPALEQRIVREELAERLVDPVDVLRVTGQRGPPERPDAATEERPDIGRDEARIRERVRDPGRLRLTAQVVAVVEDVAAGPEMVEHSLDVRRDRLTRPAEVLVRIGRAQRSPPPQTDRPRGT